MSFRVVVDFDRCESNALCMAAAPEVFEVRRVPEAGAPAVGAVRASDGEASDSCATDEAAPPAGEAASRADGEEVARAGPPRRAHPRTSWWVATLSRSRVIRAPFSAPVE